MQAGCLPNTELKMKKIFALLLSCALVVSLFPGCGSGEKKGYARSSSLASGKEVTLTLVGHTPSFKAMESVISSFSNLYPNCTVNYEYLQDYEKSLMVRLSESPDSVDLFITTNIQKDSARLPYALDLNSEKDKLSLKDTFGGLVENFTLMGAEQLYAVPMGGEIRGLFVNTTLLGTLGLSVPKNYTELLSCCKTLLDAGYVPFGGNPSNFGMLLMYPYVCSMVANASDYQAVFGRVSTCAAGVSEIFRLPMSRLYEIVKKGYYNYKYVETTYNRFTDGSDEEAVRGFLNITKQGSNYSKADDVGAVAFMPGVMSQKESFDRAKEDYHSGIEYEFILAPVGDEGGYAYLSPADGIAVNRNSPRTEWALEFLNYLFTPDVNRSFARENDTIPNTSDALTYTAGILSVDSSRVSHLGQVTFGYEFYGIVKESVTAVSKSSNPKYFKSDGTMYDLEYYMSALESAFAAHRA